MKNKKIKPQKISQLAEDWGIDYQVFKIKIQLIEAIKEFCFSNKISQRKLAAMVPGLSQDRISKIFSGQVSHMTIDKLVEIASSLHLKIDLLLKAA